MFPSKLSEQTSLEAAVSPSNNKIPEWPRKTMQGWLGAACRARGTPRAEVLPTRRVQRHRRCELALRYTGRCSRRNQRGAGLTTVAPGKSGAGVRARGWRGRGWGAGRRPGAGGEPKQRLMAGPEQSDAWQSSRPGCESCQYLGANAGQEHYRTEGQTHEMDKKGGLYLDGE